MGTRTTIAIAAVAAAAAALTGCSSDSSQEARVPPTVATAPTPWADQIFGGVAEDGPAPLDDEVAGRLARLALDADALDDPDAATSDTHVGADGAALFAAATPDGAGAGELESQFLDACTALLGLPVLAAPSSGWRLVFRFRPLRPSATFPDVR